MAQTTPWFVYLLRCYDQSIDIGITADVVDRLKPHRWDSVDFGLKGPARGV